MKNVIKSNLIMLLIALTASSALAEVGARNDNSMTLVYFFLAICGLIICLQLIPVFTILYGLVKGMFSKKEKEAKPAPVKYH